MLFKRNLWTILAVGTTFMVSGSDAHAQNIGPLADILFNRLDENRARQM